MAFGIDAVTNANAAGSANVVNNVPVTFNHTCGGSANKLCLGIGAGISSDASIDTTATYNGVAMTLIAHNYDGAFETVMWWRLNNPPTGSPFTVSFVNSVLFPIDFGAGAVSFNDAHAVEGTPAGNAINDIGGNISLAVPSAAGDIVIGQFASDLGLDGTTTADQTQLWEQEDVDGDNDFSAQRTTAVGASTTLSWTHAAPSAGFTSVVGIAIKALAVVAGAVKALMPQIQTIYIHE